MIERRFARSTLIFSIATLLLCSQIFLIFQYQTDSFRSSLVSSSFLQQIPSLPFFGTEGATAGGLTSSQLQYYKERYHYRPPSPRTAKEPGCWNWFNLLETERSRGREDQAIYEWFFKDFEGKGTYVELGAYTGKSESNSRFFDECLEWEGLLIEGNPKMEKRIIMNRHHAHKIFFAPSCAKEGNETVRFHAMPFANVGQEGATKAFAGYDNDKGITDVPCGPLSPVLESLFSGHVNFFSLDVEGAEALVLKTIDWNKVQVDVLIAESINSYCAEECETRAEVREIMKKAGYKLYINGVYRSDLFVHPSVTNSPPPQFKEGYFDNKIQSDYYTGDDGGEENKRSKQRNVPRERNRNSPQIAYYKERYGYIPPSVRGKQHPNCTTSNSSGDWEWFRLGKNERSRSSEDMAVYKWFFQGLHGKGTYVELGAYTGKDESNSRFFDECLLWDGLLIEGNPSMHDQIKTNRPHAHKIFFAPSCATEANKTVQFHTLPFANSGMKDTTKALEGYTGQVQDVPCGPLAPVLETVLNGHVSFFSLDVEGAEALILKTIDWSKVQVDVMIAESSNSYCGDQCESRSEVREIMKKAGYKLYINGIYRSDLFVHPSVKRKPPRRFVEGYFNKTQSKFFRFA